MIYTVICSCRSNFRELRALQAHLATTTLLFFLTAYVERYVE